MGNVRYLRAHKSVGEIGERIRAERLRLGMSAQQLSTALGISRVSNWESGKTVPDAAQLAEMSKLGFDTLFVVLGDYKSRFSSESHAYSEVAKVVQFYCSIRRTNPSMAFRHDVCSRIIEQLIRLTDAPQCPWTLDD